MYEAAVSPFAGWANFYMITGSAAAALTGLMFVAIALVAQVRGRSSRRAVDTYNTPTVAHFAAVLLISAIASAPWQEKWHAALLLGVGGFLGVVYALFIVRRVRKLDVYEPEWEDWLWVATSPLIAYVIIVIAAIFLPIRSTPALFGIAAATLALLFIAIHNAWDIVTYIAIERLPSPNDGSDELNVPADPAETPP